MEKELMEMKPMEVDNDITDGGDRASNKLECTGKIETMVEDYDGNRFGSAL